MAVNAGIWLAVAGFATAAGGAYMTYQASKAQAKAEKKANKARAGQAAIENRRRRAEIIRKQQMAQAQAENVQATQGGGEVSTTMATGALFTASTQGAVNLANFQEFGRQGGLLADAQLAIGRAKSKAAFGQSVMKLGMSVMSNSDRLGGLFGSGGGDAPAPVVDMSRAHPSVYEGYT